MGQGEAGSWVCKKVDDPICLSNMESEVCSLRKGIAGWKCKIEDNCQEKSNSYEAICRECLKCELLIEKLPKMFQEEPDKIEKMINECK